MKMRPKSLSNAAISKSIINLNYYSLNYDLNESESIIKLILFHQMEQNVFIYFSQHDIFTDLRCLLH